ncbi:MAG: DoxX family protein [Planctomycetales bacterium]
MIRPRLLVSSTSHLDVLHPRRNPLVSREFKIGLLAVLALVALRVSIGWHFLYQGMHKLTTPGFSAEGFLRQSRGPFSGTFRGMLRDVDGTIRLNGGYADRYLGSKDKSENGLWHDYAERFKKRYKLDVEQEEQLTVLVGRRGAVLQEWFDDNYEDIDVYLTDLQRLQNEESNPAFRDVTYHKKRMHEKRQELAAALRPWLGYLTDANRGFRKDLQTILKEDQLARGPLPLTEDEAKGSLGGKNSLIIFSNIAIGTCLILGLLTRFSSWSGAAFMFLIVLSQPAWPGYYPPPHPAVGHAMIINKEFVEMMALVVLGCTAVGRWGGLDFFVHQYVVQPLLARFARNTEVQSDEPDAGRDSDREE